MSSGRYVGVAGAGPEGGGSWKPTSQTKIFSHQCEGQPQLAGKSNTAWSAASVSAVVPGGSMQTCV